MVIVSDEVHLEHIQKEQNTLKGSKEAIMESREVLKSLTADIEAFKKESQ